jgi:carbonic anhydrase
MSTEQLTPRVTAAGSGIGRASGFELTGPGQPGAANVEAALERDRAFAAAGGHQGAVVFPNLSLFVITCLDPHTDPAHFLCLGLSDAMVVRDVGGRVTPEVINDVAFIGQLAENALPDGPLLEVAVIHHTQCGTGALAISRASPSPGTSTTSSTAWWRRPSPLTAHQLEPLNKPNRLK